MPTQSPGYPQDPSRHVKSDKDYYAVLGVAPEAEDIVIRAAFRALAQRYHPDRFGGSRDKAHARMSELNEAYGVLSDAAQIL